MGKLADLIMKADKDDDEAPDSEDGTEGLAGDVLDAIAAKDKSALADALRAFVHACEDLARGVGHAGRAHPPHP